MSYNGNPMKKLLLAFSIFFLLLSCSEKDPLPPNELYGVWDLVDMSYTGVSITEYDGTVETLNFTGEARDINCTIEFSSPNKWHSLGTYVVDLDTEGFGVISVPTIMDHTGSFRFDGTSITFKNELDEERSADIETLEQGILLFEFSFNTTTNYTNPDYTVTSTQWGSFRLEKQ